MAKDLNASMATGSVAVDGIVSTAHTKAYVVMAPSREGLPLALRGATLGGEGLATVFVAERDEDLEACASTRGLSGPAAALPPLRHSTPALPATIARIARK